MNQSKSRKVAVVTGGASGIGLGIVQTFASQGAHVAILDINTSSSDQLLPTLQSEYAEATFSFHKCNVTSWEEQLSAFKLLYAIHGRIDVVVANAGISSEDSLIDVNEEVPLKPRLDVVDVNLVGVVYTTKLAIHYISKNGIEGREHKEKGLILCTASNAGIYPFPVAPLYSMTKAGVINLVRSLARPLLAQRIRINAFAPAVLKTNIAPSEDLFKDMILTPMSTLQDALKFFVKEEELTGAVAEVHGDRFTLRDVPEYVDNDTEANLETFWKLGFA